MRYIGQDFSKKYFYGIRCYAIPDIMLMLGLPFAIEDSCANVFLTLNISMCMTNPFVHGLESRLIINFMQ